MSTVCPVTDADRHIARLERQEDRRRDARELLRAEYMQAVSMPLLTTVSTPTDMQPMRRTPFLDVLGDGLTWSKNRTLLARVVFLMSRTVEGLELLNELAKQHADDYADEVQQ